MPRRWRNDPLPDELVRLLGDSESDPGRKQAARDLRLNYNDAQSILRAVVLNLLQIRDGNA